jgi:benzoate 4-monooxygenase
MYRVVKTLGVLQKLQAELESVLSEHIEAYGQVVKSLSDLGAIVNESLRDHSSIGLGLYREIPRDTQGIKSRDIIIP